MIAGNRLKGKQRPRTGGLGAHVVDNQGGPTAPLGPGVGKGGMSGLSYPTACVLASFLPLNGTSQLPDWGLYADQHQNILKEFSCHRRLLPSLCMLPMASHCRPRLILAVPLGCKGLSHCLNTAMV